MKKKIILLIAFVAGTQSQASEGFTQYSKFEATQKRLTSLLTTMRESNSYKMTVETLYDIGGHVKRGCIHSCSSALAQDAFLAPVVLVAAMIWMGVKSGTLSFKAKKSKKLAV